MTPVKGLREGVLLEAGFAKVTPNEPKDISSWAYDDAAEKGKPSFTEILAAFAAWKDQL
jgi:hypothetical protein